MTLSAGEKLGPYEIISKLGAGGMGEVWKARDTRLDRFVAVKVLPEHIAKRADLRQRFEREARAVASLNHPHICVLFDIGNHEGADFMVMEYLEGETLAERIGKGALPLDQALRFASQAADALDRAHRAGVTHRDVKPGNIMLTRDGVKVLDFGLATLIEPDQAGDADATVAAAPLTEVGTVLGTAAYMSPEQARGQRLDARTDIFSLGVVLYQMITGTLPFRGVNALDVISSILQKEPAPLTQHVAGVPPELEHLLRKTLRKDREERYQTARDLLVDLKDLTEEMAFAAKLERSGQAAQPEPLAAPAEIIPASHPPAAPATSSTQVILGEVKRHKLGVGLTLTLLLAGIALSYYGFFARRGDDPIESLAVLPFANVSGHPDTEYLSDGLTESIIFNLSRVTRLKVLPRSTVFRYKGKDQDPRTVGRELGVRAVLAGRIVQRGGDLSVSAELIEVSENRVLWGQQYNLADALVLQQTISKEISQRLRLGLSGEEEKLVTRSYTYDNEAYQLYLKGSYHYSKFPDEDIRKSIQYFQQAIEKEPNYALAWSGMTLSYMSLWFRGLLTPEESMPKAKAAAVRAVAIDNTLAEAHLSLANVKYNYEWDFPGGEQEFKRAIELSPNLGRAHEQYGLLLSLLGRAEESMAEARRALELEPFSLRTGFNAGVIYWHARQFDRMREQGRKCIEMDPNFYGGHALIGNEAEANGRYEQAVAEITKAVELGGGTQELSGLGGVYGKMGQRDKAQQVLSQLMKLSTQRHVRRLDIAMVYAGLGEMDRAFEWLEKAYQQREGPVVWLKVIYGRRYPALGRDPRFADLLRRIGLPQ